MSPAVFTHDARTALTLALSLALSLAPIASPARAQRATPAAERDRVPAVAAVVGLLIPGGGQFYAGRPGKGSAILGVTVLAAGIAVQQFADSYDDYCSDAPIPDPYRNYPRCSDTDYYIIVGGLGVAAGAWLFGAATAPADVRRVERERRTRVGVAPGIGRHGAVLRVAVAF